MFKIAELLTATGGRLICGSARADAGRISIDSRTIRKGDTFIAIKGDNFDGHDFVKKALAKGAALVIIHKDLKIKSRTAACIKVKDTAKSLGDIAAFQRARFSIPLIAVTGSNGKTTTKEMIAAVLSAKGKVLKNPGTHNNHIGLPQTLLKLDSTYDFCVVELGTNHPGEIGYLSGICKPDIAVITNVAASHLEYFKDLKGVLSEKYSLAEKLNRKGLLIVNADDRLLAGKPDKKGVLTFKFGIRNPAEFRASQSRARGLKVEFTVNGKYKFALGTPGHYNVYNALSAIACGRIFGLSYKELAGCLSDFTFPKGRLNILGVNGLQFIDDTYNSNPYSLERALEVLSAFDTKGRKVFIMGDMMELGTGTEKFHSQAVNSALKFCDVFLGVGKATKDALKKSGYRGKCNLFTADSSAEAKSILNAFIRPEKEDVILVKGSRRMSMEEVLKI